MFRNRHRRLLANLSTQQFSPTQIAGLAGWFDASRETYSDTSFATPASSGTVAGWRDLSGSGNHLTQSSAGARPTILSSAVNSKPALDFDGGDFLGITSGLTTLMNGTDLAVSTFAVFSPDSVAAGTEVGMAWANSGDNNPHFALRLSRNPIRISKRDDAATLVEIDGPSGTTAGSYQLVQVIHNGTSTTVYRNATAGTTTAQDVAALTTNEFYVGRRSTGVTQNFNGAFAEILIYSRALNDTERIRVEEYLRVKYALF